ncbi:glycosyltransferase family 2 protein, partial [Dickeya sp. CFBP 2040]|nr:glycosyltransferase family 2 protein [Dickeya sp. CFBP 2040]
MVNDYLGFSMTKISVVIPAYNAEKTLTDALVSVVKQSGDFDFEVIVVNDGSLDSTSSVAIDSARALGIKITLIEQENKGVATARNVGVEKSTGDYIAFLDADDIWMPTKTQEQMNFLLRNNFGMIGGNFRELNANFKKLKTISESIKEVTFSNLLIKHYFQPSCVIIKKAIFELVGGFEDGMTHAEEGLLFYKICYSSRCAIYCKDVIEYGGGKHPFASGQGLSSNLWKMEKGELYNYRHIYRKGMIG